MHVDDLVDAGVNEPDARRRASAVLTKYLGASPLTAAPSRSTLNRSGVPVQIAIVSRRTGTRRRIVVDPFVHLEQDDRIGRTLDRLHARFGEDLPTFAAELLATRLSSTGTNRALCWFGIGLEDDSFTAYLSNQHGDSRERGTRIVRESCRDHSAMPAITADLQSGRTELTAVAIDGSARHKLYLRVLQLPCATLPALFRPGELPVRALAASAEHGVPRLGLYVSLGVDAGRVDAKLEFAMREGSPWQRAYRMADLPEPMTARSGVQASYLCVGGSFEAPSVTVYLRPETAT